MTIQPSRSKSQASLSSPPAGLSRRQLMVASGAVAASAMVLGPATPAVAKEPFDRQGQPRFKLSLAAYSLRQSFGFMKGKPRQVPAGERPIDMFSFIDYCGRQGFEGAELTSYFFPPEADADYFRNVKRHAFLAGVSVSGTAIGNNFTQAAGPGLETDIVAAKQWIDHAVEMGAPHVRFFAGKGKELDQHPERLQTAVQALQQCADYAAQRGIFIGVENHGNLRPEQLLKIMRQVDHPWVGINLDTGNFISDDPYADLEACVGYAVNVQLKVNMKRPSGEKYPADLPRVAKILSQAKYQGYVVLEYEDESPWENIPKYRERLQKLLS